MEAAEIHSQCLLLTVRSRLTVLTAGPERKHNAYRAGIGDCVSGYTSGPKKAPDRPHCFTVMYTLLLPVTAFVTAA